MSKITSLAPPSLEDGSNVNEDFFCEEETLPFTYTRRDGRVVKCAMIVDANRITQSAMRKYLKSIAAISREAKERETELSQSEPADETIAPPNVSQGHIEDEIVEGEPVEASETDDSEDGSDDEEFSADSLEIIAEYTDLMARMAAVDAEFLTPAIAHEPEAESPRRGWNVPHLEPTAEVLSDTAGIGHAARVALKDWYFPTSSAPEAETGNDATANTPAA